MKVNHKDKDNGVLLKAVGTGVAFYRDGHKDLYMKVKHDFLSVWSGLISIGKDSAHSLYEYAVCIDKGILVEIHGDERVFPVDAEVNIP